MNRQNPKFRQEFADSFLHPNQISSGYDDHNCKPVGSGQHCDASYESSHLPNYSNNNNPSGLRDPYNASSEEKPNERNARRYKQYAAGGNFNTASQQHNHHRQRHDYSIHPTSSYLAGGDGNTQRVRNQQIGDTRNVPSNYIQQEQTQRAAATYNKGSNSSSRFSNSSKETAVERPVGRKGKQLLHLAISKANLMQTVEEGMSDLQQKRYSNNQKPQKPADLGTKTSNDTCNCGSISSNACSSPSAGVINNKIIHPMVKKFRLLYLNNIKEEVDILQDLEVLPHRLNELCKNLENKE